MDHPELDLAQLRSFFMVAKVGSFSGAARRLHRTQSAVSHALRKLEDSTGMRLLERGGRQARPTEAGRRLYAVCESVFAALDAAQEDLQRVRERAEGHLRLGATVEFGSSVLMQHLPPLLAAHPGIELDVQLGHELLPLLLREDLDLLIDCVDHRLPQLERTPLFREEYLVACSPDYLARERIRRPQELGRCAILSLDEAGAWWRRFLATFPKARRPVLGRVIAINHVRAMINAAVHGMGVLLAPSYSVKREIEQGVLMPLFPTIRPLADRFTLYQKAAKAGLFKHRLLKEYLESLEPSEFRA